MDAAGSTKGVLGRASVELTSSRRRILTAEQFERIGHLDVSKKSFLVIEHCIRLRAPDRCARGSAVGCNGSRHLRIALPAANENP
jgi:hypothetical protein